MLDDYINNQREVWKWQTGSGSQMCRVSSGAVHVGMGEIGIMVQRPSRKRYIYLRHSVIDSLLTDIPRLNTTESYTDWY